MAPQGSVSPMTRRTFVRRSLGAGAALWVGCDLRQVPDAKSLASDGELLEVLAMGTLQDMPPLAVGKLLNQGLEARRYLDLEALTPAKLVTPVDEFFVRTGTPLNLPDVDTWSIKVDGLVKRTVELRLADLLEHEQSFGTHLMECSGNHPQTYYRLISAGRWHGVALSHVLGRADIDPRATRVLIVGHDDHPRSIGISVPGASWVFTLRQLTDAGAFLATRLNDQPLRPELGAPVRLFVPGWFGCCNIKWVKQVKLVDDDQPTTAHMIEYANRTGQTAEHPAARDYTPALMDLAAVPIRVERRSRGGKTFFRVVGIMWGGDKPTESLTIRCGVNASYEPVKFITPPSPTSWRMWTYDWRPNWPGTYMLMLQFTDTTLPTRRMDHGFGNRTIAIKTV